MALPPLLNYAYSHGPEEVVQRGKKIFHTGGVQLLDFSTLEDRIRFRVRNDQYNNFYTVSIQDFSAPDNLNIRCQCPYNLGDICRHEVAALFQLNDMVQSGFFEKEAKTYHQSHTVVRLQQINTQLMGLYTSPAALEQAQEAASLGMAALQPAQGDTLQATVHDAEGNEFPIRIQQSEARYYHTSCTCDEEEYPLCVHKATVFLQARRQFGEQFFQRLQNYDAHKNKLLAQYGYSLADNLKGKFEFYYQEGKPFLRLLDPGIKKVTQPAPGAPPAPAAQDNPEAETTAEARAAKPAPPLPTPPAVRRLGIVAEPGLKEYPGVRFRLISGMAGEDGFIAGNLREEDLALFLNPLDFPQEEQSLIPALRKLLPAELGKWLRKNMPFGDLMEADRVFAGAKPTADELSHARAFLLPRWQQLFKGRAEYLQVFTLKKKGKPMASNLLPIRLSDHPATIALSAAPEGDGSVQVRMQWVLEGETYEPSQVEAWNEGLVFFDGMLYAAESKEVMELATVFLPKGTKKVSAKDWPAFLRARLLPLYKTLSIRLAAALMERGNPTRPALRIYLAETEGQLTLSPAFMYDNDEVRWGYEGDVVMAIGNRLRIQPRDEAAEEDFLGLLQSLHTDMRRHDRLHFFYLPASAVLAGNWFFQFMDAMREHQVEVLGQEELRELRISPHRPQTSLRVSSGIDWLDAELDIIFGDQRISIAEVKKALSQNQQFVPLTDGSLGMLPEEWLKKHALLIKMGEGHGKTLRLKKTQFGVLDQLLSAVDETKLADELEEKKRRLETAIDEERPTLEPPPGLQAVLRPYQQAGYQWLTFLKETGWGGLLADDMGLGKTVQALALFQQLADADEAARFLVVCPTTLVYNWEAEARRFTPTLSTHIHHGPKRAVNADEFAGVRIVITTYGTMRSDILMLKAVLWTATVLDESQAIKNPVSQVAKASLLIQSKYRFALSGTPVQNNTFDLYAQLNFLNPGLLGSREFFQNEFATPIDKFGETEVRDQLRQLTYPFILRRSKEEVAKDLPAKTEQVLWCEMGAEQRNIYDAYRNDYRAEILGMIDTKGMERSQLHILQGLTKLRQICDSPAILNEAEKYPNHSVKLEELVREITENVGHHKALIFSQFLGMLALIRSAVIKAGIDFAYFDGSATTVQRNEAVRKFQGKEDCRVFLISLKAGGVGLNLTAADYVYIVDPWWNPAVEQQAIDRTHRIGQTKNIVAYRMICKDTIEEKILLLQERKRELAAGLISNDNAMMKKMTRDDIAFLLS